MSKFPELQSPICFIAVLVVLLTATVPPVRAETSAETVAMEVEGPTVAEVDTRRISKAELQRETLRVLGNELNYFEEKQLHALQKSVLDRMVERELLLHAARDWRQSDEGRHQDERLLLAEYLREVVFSGTGTNGADAEVYFEDAARSITVPDELEVREIVLLFPESDRAHVDKDRLRVELEKIRSIVVESPQRFSELARKQSNARSAARGGLRGFLTLSQLEPEVAEVAAELEVNEVSPIVESSRGYHLLRIEQIRQAPQLSTEERSARIQALLDAKRQSDRLKEHLAQLRRRYKVIVYLD